MGAGDPEVLQGTFIKGTDFEHGAAFGGDST